MKSLLIKEFYNIKDAVTTNILIMLALSVFSVIKIGTPAIMPITVIGMSTLIVSSLRAEKEKDWNKYELTMPISRKEVIISKYVLYLLLCLSGLAIGLIMNAAAIMFSGGPSFSIIAIYMCISLVIALLSGSALIPLIYKLGVDKSETLSLLCYSVPIVLLVGILIYMKGKVHTLGAVSNLSLWLTGILFAAGVIFVISGIVSYKMYKKRQF